MKRAVGTVQQGGGGTEKQRTLENWLVGWCAGQPHWLEMADSIASPKPRKYEGVD